jgi:hypothetical protein
MTLKTKELPNFKTEIHMISPLPLELIILRIESFKTFVVSIKSISPDESDFELESVYPKKLKLKGKLLRWNGAFTRLDANCTSQSAIEGLKFVLPFACLMLLIVFLLNGWNSLGALLASPVTFCVIPFMLVPFAIIILPLILGTSFAFSTTGDDESQTAIAKMLENFVDRLSESSDEILEFDGSELSLEMLLQEEKYKHFSIADDGEVEDKT